jgi:Zinc carboxypeptidase/Secretion system C-terminal sorting domain
MKPVLKYFAATIFFLLIINTVKAQKRTIYHRISANINRPTLTALQKNGLQLDHFEFDNNTFIAELTEEEISIITGQGITINYLLKDLELNYAKHNQKLDSIYYAQERQTINARAYTVSTPVNFTLGSMGGFPTYAEIIAAIDSMQSKFPSLVSVKDSIGVSYEGRTIYSIRISDNPAIDEPEDELLLTSLHHANEPMGISAALFFLWHVLENYNSSKEYQTLLNNMEIYFVPCVNPDGYVYNEINFPSGGGMQRKNRRANCATDAAKGVDLNRNYNYKWGINSSGSSSNPCHTKYSRGSSAWSEPETKTMRDFVNRHAFVIANNYHAFGDFYMYPWAYVDSLPDAGDSILFKQMGAYCTDGISSFKHGNFNRTLNYLANGECSDWLYGDQISKPKTYAVTIEIGKSADGGFWPASSNIVPLCNRIMDMNIKTLRMTPKYAKISDSSQSSFSLLNNHIRYSIQRFSIKSTSFTVSVTPLSNWVIATGNSKVYNTLDFLQSTTDSVSFSLNPSTPNGTILRFVIETNNGSWSIYDTVSRIYNAPVTLPIKCDKDFEPDNSTTMARPVEINHTMYSKLSYTNDEDWYQVNLNNGESLMAVLYDMPDDYNISIYNGAKKQIDFSENPGRKPDTIVLNQQQVGTYYIRITGFNGKSNNTYCYRLNVNTSNGNIKKPVTSSIHWLSLPPAELKIYPTPAHETLRVIYESPTRGVAEVSIKDVSGIIVYKSKRQVQKGETNFTIPVSSIISGVYMLLIQQENQIVTTKFIKM